MIAIEKLSKRQSIISTLYQWVLKNEMMEVKFYKDDLLSQITSVRIIDGDMFFYRMKDEFQKGYWGGREILISSELTTEELEEIMERTIKYSL